MGGEETAEQQGSGAAMQERGGASISASISAWPPSSSATGKGHAGPCPKKGARAPAPRAAVDETFDRDGVVLAVERAKAHLLARIARADAAHVVNCQQTSLELHAPLLLFR